MDLCVFSIRTGVCVACRRPANTCCSECKTPICDRGTCLVDSMKTAHASFCALLAGLAPSAAAVPREHMPPDDALVRRWADRHPVKFEAYAYFGAAGGKFTIREEGRADETAAVVVAETARAWVASMPQRGAAWLNVRHAFVTGSNVATYCGLGFDGEAGLRKQFALDAGDREETFAGPQRQAMQYGTWQEKNFFEAYKALAKGGDKLQSSGFVICGEPGKGYFGASPDGLVGEDGAIEIKTTASQQFAMRYFDNWLVQIQMVLLCANRQWCDLLRCYRPRGNRDDFIADASTMRMWRVHRATPVLLDRLCECATRYVESVFEAKKATSGGAVKQQEAFLRVSHFELRSGMRVEDLGLIRHPLYDTHLRNRFSALKKTIM